MLSWIKVKLKIFMIENTLRFNKLDNNEYSYLKKTLIILFYLFAISFTNNAICNGNGGIHYLPRFSHWKKLLTNQKRSRQILPMGDNSNNCVFLCVHLRSLFWQAIWSWPSTITPTGNKLLVRAIMRERFRTLVNTG